MADMVNHPSHYEGQCGVECIDFIEGVLDWPHFVGYCVGNCLKYIWRYQNKNGQEDLEKAAWYIKYAHEIMDKYDKYDSRMSSRARDNIDYAENLLKKVVEKEKEKRYELVSGTGKEND